MIWLYTFLILLIFILCYLLFAPFYIEINSESGLCRMRFHKLLSAQLKITESSLIVEIKAAWWRKRIDLLVLIKQKGKPVKKIEKKKNKNVPFKKIINVIKSFKVTKFYVTICFDDMPLNGILYPLFLGLSLKTKKHFEINFWNENEIVLRIENNLFRIIWAYIKS